MQKQRNLLFNFTITIAERLYASVFADVYYAILMIFWICFHRFMYNFFQIAHVKRDWGACLQELIIN